MDYSIDTMVASVCSPEYVRTHSDVIELMEQLEYEDWMQDMDQLAMCQDMYDRIDLHDAIKQRTFTHLDYLLRQHEIIATDTARLEELLFILQCLQLVVNSEEHNNIISICTSGEEPIEQLIKLMELVAVVDSPNHYYTVLADVPASLIGRISEIHRVDETDETAYLTSSHALELKDFKQFLKETEAMDEANCWAFKVLSMGMQPGGDFHHYWTVLEGKVTAITEPKQLAVQLAAIMALGADTYNRIFSYWREHNSQLVADTMLLTTTDTEFIALIDRYNRWKFAQNKT